LDEVKEPSLAEEMNDEIPDFDKTGLGIDQNFDFDAKSGRFKKIERPLPPARRNLKKPAKTSTKATGKRRLTNLDVG